MRHEYNCWKRLLAPGLATIRTPWGEEQILQTRGIRQGAVESPFLFSVAMECALREAQDHPDWPKEIGAAPDLYLQELLYMDDTVLWSGSKQNLVTKFSIFKDALARWGLTVNPVKTAYYPSPHATESGPLILDGTPVEPSPALEVMGIPLQVPLKPAGLLDSGLAKARKKYFANRDILEGRGPIKGRLKTLQMTVGGAALWYSAAVPPSPQALGAVNALQQELVARMAGIKRRPQESWLDHRMRSLRGARQILATHKQERWSTCWLRRYWGYKGHVARAAHRSCPPSERLPGQIPYLPVVGCTDLPTRWDQTPHVSLPLPFERRGQAKPSHLNTGVERGCRGPTSMEGVGVRMAQTRGRELGQWETSFAYLLLPAAPVPDPLAIEEANESREG